MRSLVTGASGFAAKHLLDLLHSEGHDAVGANRENAPDLLDHDGWVAHLRNVRPSIVYHLAARSSVAESWNDPRGTFRANAEGTWCLLSACREAGVERVLTISTSDVYGNVRPGDLPLRESAPLAPMTPYAASKAAAEQIAVQAHLGYGQDVVRVRAFTHLGAGQDTRFVAAALAARIVAAERDGAREIPVGNLSPRRDFTDVRDVVRAYRLLAESGTAGEVYNVCSGRAVSIAELADQLVAMATVPLELRLDQSLLRPVDVPVLWGSNERLVAATGWSPAIPLADTLAIVLAEARASFDSPPR